MMTPLRLMALVWRHRTMVVGLARHEMHTRFAGSMLGRVWALVQPLLYMVLYLVVFSWILRIRFTAEGNGEHFALYLLAGLLPWLAFQEGVLKSASSIVENAALVKGMAFPTVVLVASAVLASVANLMIGLGLFLPVLLALGHLSWQSLLVLPLLIGLQIAFTLGVGLIVAGIYPFLRDLLPLLQFGLTIWFYLTPIFYPISYVPKQLAAVFVFNPFVPVVAAYRVALLDGALPAGGDLVIVGVWAIGAIVLGSILFSRVEPGFADVL